MQIQFNTLVCFLEAIVTLVSIEYPPKPLKYQIVLNYSKYMYVKFY